MRAILPAVITLLALISSASATGAALGADCYKDDECAPELYCAGGDTETRGEKGKCAARLPLGSKCMSLTRGCVGGLKCDPTKDSYVSVPGFCTKDPKTPNQQWALDDPCVSRASCGPDFFCQGGSVEAPGKCAALPKEGEACKGECASCSFCRDGKCVKKLPLDSVCGPKEPCAAELYCNTPKGEKAGKCAAKKPDGTRCASNDECEQGTICYTPGDEPICMKQSPNNDLGGVCFGTSHCKGGLYCDQATSKSRGKCATKKAEGAECGTLDACTPDVFCNIPKGEKVGKCTKKKPAGSSCVENVECEKDAICRGGREDGMCMKKGAKADANGVCFSTQECNTGLYCEQPGSNRRGKCIPRGEGAACKKYDDCGNGFYCAAKGKVTKCAKKLGLGAVCTMWACSDGLLCAWCGAKLGFCVKSDDSSKKFLEGAKCFVSNSCAKGLYCETPGVNKIGKCVPKKADGADCLTGQRSCPEGSRCKGPQEKNPPRTAGKCEKKDTAPAGNKA